MHRIPLSVLSIILAGVAAPAWAASPSPSRPAAPANKTAAHAAQPLSCHHLPPAHAPADRPLNLDFAIAPLSRLAAGHVHWRSAEGGIWRRAPIQLASTGRMRATIPANVLTDPGLAYYVVLRDTSGGQSAHFASEAHPHRVIVRGDAGLVRRELAEMELGGLRSELELAGSWVDFHTLGGDATIGPDYRGSTLRFRHWLLGGVEYIEFGVGTLRGQAPPDSLPGTQPTHRVPVGFDRGWAQVGFRMSETVGSYGRLLLGGDEQTFRVGVAGGLRIGRPRHARLLLETGVIGGVGAHVMAAFHLDTIERWPLAVEIQLDNLPNATAEVAERVRLRLGHEISANLVAEMVATYQAQRHEDHGFGAGARLAMRF